MSLMHTPCVLVSRSDAGAVDDDGNVVYEETETDTVCSLKQIRRDEPGGEGELSVATYTLFLPTGTSIDTGDAARVGGKVYEVVGEPDDELEGSPFLHHIEATVKRTAGAEDV